MSSPPTTPLDLSPFRVAPGSAPHLVDRETAATGGMDKAAGKQALAAVVKRIAAAQERLWADRRWAVLVVLQGLDTSGKDGVIKHVLSGVNPQGVQVTSFVAPNRAELSHDFLWRVHRHAPPRGMVGVFNRSHYEELIVPRVQPAVLDAAGLPDALRGSALWSRRQDAIAAFERHLAGEGTAILKLFLHISAEQQRRRLLARLDDPAKHWKFDPSDIGVHERFGEYLAAYEAAITATSVAEAPWHVIPADHKWFARLAAAEALATTLESLDLSPPQPSADMQGALEQARAKLRAEGED